MFSGIIYFQGTRWGAYAMKGVFYLNEDFSGMDAAYVEYIFETEESYWMDLKAEAGQEFGREWEPWCQD